MGNTYIIGQNVEGTIEKLVPFGAFVKLSDGHESLLHITEMVDANGEATVERPENAVNRGATYPLTIKVVYIRKGKTIVSLTMRNLNDTIERPSSLL